MRPSTRLRAFTTEDGLPGEDCLFVSKDVWDELIRQGARCVPSRAGSGSRLLVSITLDDSISAGYETYFTTNHQGQRSPCSSFLSYVRISYATEVEKATVRIPPQFFTRNELPVPDPDDEVDIELHTCGTVELNEVILGALDQASYETATKDGRSIQNQLIVDATLLRQSATCRISVDDNVLVFRVLMCSPVLQGTISANSRVIFSRAEWLVGPDLSMTAVKSLGNESLVPDVLLDDAGIEDGLHFSTDADRLDADFVDAAHEEEIHGSRGSLSSVEALPVVLSHRVPRSMVYPKPGARDDLDIGIWVPYSILVKLKVFSGSMVSVLNDPSSAEGRLCRIYGCDTPFEQRGGSQLPNAYMSPSLYFNMQLNPSKPIHLMPLSREQMMEAIPVASEVTVARLAGSLTNDKRVLDECLIQLRKWFEDTERVVCEGDIITVVVNEEQARMHALFSMDDSDEIVEHDLQCFPAAARANDLAYFKITHVAVDSSIDSKGTSRSMGVMVKIDPAVTRITQSGIAHGRVPPRQRSYLGAGIVPTAPEKSASDAYRELSGLMSTCLHPTSLALGLNCTVLLHGPRGAGKRTLIYAVAEDLGIHLLEVNAYDIIGDTDAKTESFLQIQFEKAAATAPCVLIIRHVDALAKKPGAAAAEPGDEPTVTKVLSECLTMISESFKTSGHVVMVVGTTADLDKIPTGMQALFRHHLLCESPSEEMRLHILTNLTKGISMTPDVSLPLLAMQTAALVARDLVDLVARAGYNALERVLGAMQALGHNVSESDVVHAGVAVTSEDFSKALDKSRAAHSDAIGAPKIPNVTWDDVGGLSHVKDNIYDTIQLPLEHPELFASGMKKRSGILLYGPPGTGKTLVAKAVATNFSLNFLSVKGPELLNMYIGESEANVRRVFQKARDARPCVVFFDELDSVAPKRGEKGDSGGVMDRIVSQLLAEIDGMGGGADVFVIGATNRPDLLDPALLRPGRFDKLLYLGVSEDHDSQLNILKALTRKFRLHPSLDLRRIADLCPFHYTGADFYALCSDAMLKAIIRTIDNVDAKIATLNASGPHEHHPHPIPPPYYLENMAEAEDTFVQVEEVDFRKALEELVPSVSPKELQRYKEVRSKFETEDKEDKKKGKGKAVADMVPSVVDRAQLSFRSDAGKKINGGSSQQNGHEPIPVPNGLPPVEHVISNGRLNNEHSKAYFAEEGSGSSGTDIGSSGRAGGEQAVSESTHLSDVPTAPGEPTATPDTASARNSADELNTSATDPSHSTDSASASPLSAKAKGKTPVHKTGKGKRRR
ncbi:AAA family ATPase peroxin 6 [Spizellomyces punctatus DAOM BR117]|uniref:Peroxisomal ATPase PEX6 n=1 Tax=Spizellomyces punctatus (strain DAOM BR117) TaxID=645134 RepID=A0A0L0HK16_SPIPD|nr:AAA family ATPase peroxin 6 [Spizellomyces punctatus DAOM BR117]KND01806.1 hypothetical protein SPPG_03597 [Spizellomyces punctatus DAOM BR117]|eukprot:XP_016609845.1 hypothetical protein SPPG_03597 [Spizellomyces punctatus DAOM BR117]